MAEFLNHAFHSNLKPRYCSYGLRINQYNKKRMQDFHTKKYQRLFNGEQKGHDQESQRDIDQKQYKKKYITLHKIKVFADQNVDLSSIMNNIFDLLHNNIKKFIPQIQKKLTFGE